MRCRQLLTNVDTVINEPIQGKEHSNGAVAGDCGARLDKRILDLSYYWLIGSFVLLLVFVETNLAGKQGVYVQSKAFRL